MELNGYPGKYKVNFTDGTSDESEDDGRFLIPGGKTVKSFEGMDGKFMDDGFGNSQVLIGRSSTGGPVNIEFLGTGDGPYTLVFRTDTDGYKLIGSVAELRLIGKDGPNMSGSYRQEAEIDLLGDTRDDNEYGNGPEDVEWEPIGAITGGFAGNFTGTFDGKDIYIRHC